jgi:hypothetical protein
LNDDGLLTLGLSKAMAGVQGHEAGDHDIIG